MHGRVTHGSHAQRNQRVLAFHLGLLRAAVTWPSHVPARVFNLSKDFCASVWAKARVESDIRTTDSIKRRDFMFYSPQKASLECSVNWCVAGRSVHGSACRSS